LDAGELERLVAPIAADLGYTDRSELPVLGSPDQICFSRRGSYFTLEAICWGWRRRPRAVLLVDYVGSALSAEELGRQGIEGNCFAESLFHAQVSLLGRDPNSITPGAIELGPGDEWSDVVLRIEQELRAAEAVVWPRLQEKWLRVTGRSSFTL
jgi:hypothetical protein